MTRSNFSLWLCYLPSSKVQPVAYLSFCRLKAKHYHSKKFETVDGFHICSGKKFNITMFDSELNIKFILKMNEKCAHLGKQLFSICNRTVSAGGLWNYI